MSLQGANKFHAHLDVCSQCRDHPFDLCAVGQSLLILAVQDLEGPENLIDAGPLVRDWVRRRVN